MENRCSLPCPLSKQRILLLIINYFVGYNLLYPLLLRDITLRLNPEARVIPVWMQIIVYLFMIGISVILAWPILQESYHGILLHRRHLCKTIVKLLGIYYLCSITVNLLVLLFSATPTSSNQAQIITALEVSPLLTFFSAVIYAPIVEEILFRGVFFRCLRPYLKFWQTAFISGLLFGFLHVMDSFLVGNYSDMIYLFSYSVIGIFSSLVYEKTESIYGSMIFHFINNAVAFLMLTV